jgi:hypothetical protein
LAPALHIFFAMPPKEKPDRHHGGQEPPDELQDSPEQNEGYDEAVRNGPAGETASELEADEITDHGGSVE